MKDTINENLKDVKVVDTGAIAVRKLQLIGSDMPAVLFKVVPGYYYNCDTPLSVRSVYISVDGVKTLLYLDTSHRIYGNLYTESQKPFIDVLNTVINGLDTIVPEYGEFIEIDIKTLDIKISIGLELLDKNDKDSLDAIVTFTKCDGLPLFADGRAVKVLYHDFIALCNFIMIKINERG